MLRTSESRSRRGFTLVELVLVIMILMILAAVAGPSLSRMMKGSRVEQAAKTVVSALYEARMQSQHLRTTVGVFYGDDPAKLGALWAPPLSSTLPRKNQIEIWTLGNNLSVLTSSSLTDCKYWNYEDGITASSATPSNPSGAPNTAWWFPFYDKKTPLTEVPYSIPDGVRILAGDFNSDSGDFSFGNCSLTPLGEIKRHNNVYTRNGSLPTFSNAFTYRWVMVYDTASGEALVIEVGDWKNNSRPRILPYHIKSVAGVALTDASQLDGMLK